MRLIAVIFGALWLSSLLLACDPKDPASSSPPATITMTFTSPTGTGSTQSNGASAKLVGRWEIIPLNIIEHPIANTGWKIIRIQFAVESKNSGYSAANIPSQGAQVFTDPTHSYEAKTLRTTGANVVSVPAIIFREMLPPGIRIQGEYDGDAVVSYCFEAQIPKDLQPKFIRLPGYDGNIVLDPRVNWSTAFVNLEKLRSSGTSVNIEGRAILTANNFSRMRAWPIAYDIVRADLKISNKIETQDTILDLHYVTIGEDGILGPPFLAAPDCKPELKIGPKQTLNTRICALIPHASNDARLIFTGDVQEIYDTLLGPAP